MNGEFEPLETITKRMKFGMNYINIVLLDASLEVHIATYDDKEGIYKNFHTQKEIHNALMWCEIPRFNEGVFDALCDNLTQVKR